MSATSASVAKATQVFETVELMEAILLNINTRDILIAMRAMRAMRNTVLGSVKIQRGIGLIPDHNTDFRTPLWIDSDGKPYESSSQAPTFHGLMLVDLDKAYAPFVAHCRSVSGQYFDDCIPIFDQSTGNYDKAGFTIVSESATLSCPVGSRVKSLSLCQPPAKEMDIFQHCTFCGHGHLFWVVPEYVSKLLPENGQFITIGDVMRGTVETRRAHGDICKAGREASVALEVELHASVDLRYDDPIRQARRREVKGSI